MSQQKPAKVLVVDDDPVIRDMMVDMLEFEGYPVQVVRNGNDALHILRDEGNFLVFLDLMMPGLSGKDVCTILDAEPRVRNRHVIVLMTAIACACEPGLPLDFLLVNDRNVLKTISHDLLSIANASASSISKFRRA